MIESRVYLKGMNGNTAWFSRSRVYPIYGTNVSMQRDRADEEMYFRDKMNGTFTFQGNEYEYIRSGSVNTEWTMEVWIYDYATGNEAKFGEVTFHKTDCKINENDKNVEINFSTKDRYTELMAKIDDRYNLVNLAPAIEPITVIKRPILQLYLIGDSKITNIVGGVSYEIDSESENDPDVLEDEYHFLSIADLGYSLNFEITDPSRVDTIEGLRDYLEDTYIPDWAEEGQPTPGQVFYYESENGRRIKGTPSGTRWAFTFVDDQGQPISFTYSTAQITITWGVRDFAPAMVTSGVTFSYMGSVFNIASAVNLRMSLYARLMFDVPDGVELESWQHRRPAEDICSTNLNYRYITEGDYLGFERAIRVGEGTSELPTRWGLSTNNKYFVQPEQTVLGDLTHVMPIAMSLWSRRSFWFEYDAGINFHLREYECPVEIRDAYPLMSAIGAILNKMNVGITLGSSIFFSNDNPMLGSATQQKIFITPITNIKRTYYMQAAQKGDITLRQVLDMLRDTWQCYWYVNENRQLIIEHISWFKNGGSYDTDSRVVLKDLTSIASQRRNKPWAYDIDTYSYDIGNLPRRLEFGWSDNATAPFNGNAREFSASFLKDGQAESHRVVNFYSDIDYVIANPDQVTDDCFAVLSTNLENKMEIQSIDFAEEGEDIYTAYLQNRGLAFVRLFRFWLYNLPFWNYEPQYRGEIVMGIRMAKKQENVEFPCDIESFYREGLLKTNLGYGEIKSIELNLSSMMAKATLIYDTEQQS